MTLAPTWLSGDAWRREDSQVERLSDPRFFIELAQRAEAAHLDFVFRPDSLGAPPPGMAKRPGGSGSDPTLLMTLLAGHTSHIGLLTTASTTFFPPYILARALMTLHWLSGGRAGWNIVTSLDGQRNFGLDEMPSAEDRYARAAEAVQAIRALWQTCPRGGETIDRGAGLYDSATVPEPIKFEGAYYQIEGPLGAMGHSAPLPLFQAGASDVGRGFAAGIADGTFAACPDKAAAIELRADLRRRAEAQGRPADAVRVMPGLSLFLADSEAEAQELYRDTHAGTSRAQKLAKLTAMIGLDLSDWEGTRNITAADLPPLAKGLRSRTHAELLHRKIARSQPTLDELLAAPEVLGSAHWQVIGTPGQAIDAIRDWADEGAMDGIILFPGGSVPCLDLTLATVPAALAEDGRFRKGYEGRDFATHLGVAGQ
ncbi:NtaA/DmoA family FMN-dependent monooxygenase [Alloyangia pacifica]|uniref:FMN-dependent oxidoreductase, nitrilotriacetate monooxygenase family n=1 Tax=Alloyangia pacifica TaxID=311180 RepID=A0A1I6SY49_9RHOB|nr:NtaA/DmoA family FMN-dependent monooxygenase [Alloyangia pacifica]SDG91028.1 FMN-dependent oxidoreductase, nitrilotriacetate monooxygenase family [Alloyangia pacifica]SFS81820.1 FMN-dependent oxidoreductase, nitrilotriacetate monooxygenase family [Alloyangia pacifica]